ncbi:MAG: hypothetical protein WC250_00860 [Candidatus Paceibacterota bacterium]|jgi:hypothetical protein
MAPLSLDTIIERVATYIVNPLIALLFALAVLYFIYGVFVYMQGAESEEERTKGGQHILWGAIGMFVMVSVYGIIRLILTTFNIPFR